jgi:hypothetical protein
MLSQPVKQEMNSRNIPDASERVKELSGEVVLPAKITDAEYYLFNSGGLSNSSRIFSLGPKDIHYQYVVKTSPGNTDEWHKGLEQVKTLPEDVVIIEYLSGFRKQNWQTVSKPEIYEDQYSRTIIFKKEGIIYKEIKQY